VLSSEVASGSREENALLISIGTNSGAKPVPTFAEFAPDDEVYMTGAVCRQQSQNSRSKKFCTQETNCEGTRPAIPSVELVTIFCNDNHADAFSYAWAENPDDQSTMVMIDQDNNEYALELAQLQQEHRDLDAAIEALHESPAPDLLRLQRMKKRKLQLRDRISFIEDQITPDIIA
jgi:hypothetical protein